VDLAACGTTQIVDSEKPRSTTKARSFCIPQQS
jgi:hypothetical protein